MNILLWILQGALALLYLAGGAYKAFKPAELAKQQPGVPAGAWRLLGVIELVGAIVLVVPAAVGWRPGLSGIAAIVLTVETLALAAMYARRSTKFVTANPMSWAVVMGVMMAVVAFGRYSFT